MHQLMRYLPDWALHRWDDRFRIRRHYHVRGHVSNVVDVDHASSPLVGDDREVDRCVACAMHGRWKPEPRHIFAKPDGRHLCTINTRSLDAKIFVALRRSSVSL
jgi:hypothetical protein